MSKIQPRRLVVSGSNVESVDWVESAEPLQQTIFLCFLVVRMIFLALKVYFIH